MTRSDLIPPTPSAGDYAASPPPDDSAFFASHDPFALFAEWLTAARAKEPNDPNAMTLATVDAEGMPDARMVLLKDVDADGFVFYTNLESAKGRQLAATPRAALVFHWKSLRRQVRVRGAVAPASAQSRPLEGRFALEKAAASLAVRFGLGAIPRPPFWSGFRLEPVAIEFWRDRPFRLHDRLVFSRPEPDSAWTSSRLYP
jgi:pyridoxamine 5'-phosphate oxidase